MNRGVSTLSAVVVLLVSGAARGDAIPPPPTDCTAGTEGNSGHNCTYCSAKTCTGQSTCAADTTCQAVKRCVETVTCVNRSGSWPAEHISGSCPSGACGTGTCKTLQICMASQPDAEIPQLDSKSPQPGGDAAAFQPNRGCKCELDPGKATSAAPIWLLVAAAIVLCCRRRRR